MTLAGAGVPANNVVITGPTSAEIVWYTAEDKDSQGNPMGPPTQAQRDKGAATLATFDWSDVAEQAYQDSLQPEKADLRSNIAGALADIDAFLLIADTATAAQVRNAVKKLAQIQRRQLVYTAKQINNG